MLEKYLKCILLSAAVSSKFENPCFHAKFDQVSKG